MAETLRQEDCQQALKKFLQTDKIQLKSFKILDFHNPLQGLLGEHFTLKVDYQQENENKSVHFFVKTLSSNELIFNFSKQIQAYEKEEFFYKLLDEYQNCNIDTSFAPKGLFFKPYVTVLEMVPESYKSTPKRKLLDLEHCKSCLSALAKFHASSVIYEKKKEQELKKKFSLVDENSKILEDSFARKEESLATQYLVCAIEGIYYLIDLVLENYKTNDDFKKKLMEVLSLETDSGLISGILHGDLWTSNFLHLYKNGKPVESKLLDFQLLKYGALEDDVVTFLMTNTNRAFRRENFENVVQHYYQKLKENVAASGLKADEILPDAQEFLTSCDNFKIGGKIHAIVDHFYTFMADEIYEEVTMSDTSLKKFLFEDRSKYVVDSYNNNAEFKKVMCEDVVELRDLLFS